jgi:tRNA-Thr(GGU) m(6)t(6)A37 methyltransferase TsaA
MNDDAITEIVCDPIGLIHSCYKEKFGIPRQPGLVSEAVATIELIPPYNVPEAVRDLDQFSHLWLIFHFHATYQKAWNPTVRPPRLGGNQRLGVFATRSMYRPNSLGLSVVQLKKIIIGNASVKLEVIGSDLLDQTPVIDIKPYLPYSDSLPDAKSGYAQSKPGNTKNVIFSANALEQCKEQSVRQGCNIQRLIEQVLQQDPRPAYQKNQQNDRLYAMKLFDFDLKWKYKNGGVYVVSMVGTLSEDQEATTNPMNNHE